MSVQRAQRRAGSAPLSRGAARSTGDAAHDLVGFWFLWGNLARWRWGEQKCGQDPKLGCGVGVWRSVGTASALRPDAEVVASVAVHGTPNPGIAASRYAAAVLVRLSPRRPV